MITSLELGSVVQTGGRLPDIIHRCLHYVCVRRWRNHLK